MPKTNLINKLLVLIATGMPGLQKLIIFLIIEIFFGIVILGKFSNDFYIIQLIIIFNAIGLSGLILVKIPKLDESEKKIFMNKILWTYLILTFISFFLLLILEQVSLIYTSFYSFILLISIGLNLLLRHFYLSSREYREILSLDLFVIFIFLICFNFVQNVFLLVIVSYFLSTILFLVKCNFFSFLKFLKKNDFINSLNISFLNLLTGGVYLIFTPLVNFKLGVSYSAFFGIIFIVASIVVLIPMALSLYYLPIMSKNVLNNEIFKKIYRNFEMMNYLSLVVLFLLSIFIYYVLSRFILIELFSVDNSFVLFLLFVTSMITSKLSLPISNVYLSHEKTFLMTKTNIKIILFNLICFVSLSLTIIDNLLFIEIFLLCITLGNVFRIVNLKKNLKKEKIL